MTFKIGYPKSALELGDSKILHKERGRFKQLVSSPINGHNVLEMYLERIEDIVINKLEELSSMKHPVEFLMEMRKASFEFVIHIFFDSCDQDTVNKIGDLFNVMSIALLSFMPINVPGFAYNKALKVRYFYFIFHKDFLFMNMSEYFILTFHGYFRHVWSLSK